MASRNRDMGDDEGWSESTSGLLLNGLVGASVIPHLDKERWAEAEETTAKLIACIQPNQASEDRRTAVAHYVHRLILNCFPCQVFKFGSVPLKTYLPDGDIDLTAFSKDQNLKETWAHQVRDMLEKEEKTENAEFRVKEVQYIQAEVKIIKCLVENIVVDISFNQLGGLCTLCFLEEVDNLINHSHLFKRSIILIKAWCYYESRILGAHHGLISTYALETLVLYIFHVFNNSFLGPLEVLYRFLEFFSKFDWDNYCVSLWGPVPINALPDVTAHPPRKDGGDILLSKLFLQACSTVYAVLPTGQESQGQPFVSKHFNVIDPLRVNNNLGRSVSKGNFFRIRSAFAFGAKKLARLLECPKEDLYLELNQFFMNTWERHGSGHRPDAPRNELWRLRLSDPDSSHGSENVKSSSNNKTTDSDDQVEMIRGSHNTTTSQHVNFSAESMSRTSESQTDFRSQSGKTHVNSSSMRLFDQTRKEIGINQGIHTDKSQRSSKLDNLAGDLQGRYLFARTHSSPELTETYGEVSSQGRRTRITESGKSQSSARLDNRRKNQDSNNFSSHGIRSSNVDPSPARHAPSHHVPDVSVDLNNISNRFHDDGNMATLNEEFVPLMGTQGMHQEQQDYENSAVGSVGVGFNGQVHVPLSLASSHVLPFSPSVLASMGYGQRNLGGVVPSNFPLVDGAWGTNVQFPPGFVSSPLAHYFQGMGLTSNPEDLGAVHENFSSLEINQGEADQDFWHEHERGSSGVLDNDNGSFESHQSDDRHQSTSASYYSVSSSSRVQQKFDKESQGLVREDQLDTFSHKESGGTELYLDDRVVSSRSFPPVHGGSLKSRTSSESSWEGSSAKVSKPMREKRGRKTGTPSTKPAVFGKGKRVSDHSSNQADDDTKEWNVTSNVGLEMIERNIGSQAATSLHVPLHQIPGFEPTQSSGSESLMPFGPVLLGPGSRQRTTDNSGVLAFYPTGPPVPFVTMVPFYSFSPETGNSDASTSQFSGEEGLENSDSSQNFDSSEGHDHFEGIAHHSMQRAAGVEPTEHKSDILNGDFASHWQNLQYGRFCQNYHYPTPLAYHSPVMMPPMYLHGRFPWDGPGRPSTNTNVFTQLMSYGPRIVPFAPLQSVSNRPTGSYQHYLDEMPRYRGGTGTYLPNPKVSVRDRHSSNPRKGNYNYDRNDHHGDREWNSNQKSRAAGRSHSRSVVEKSSSRLDRLAASENRADRPWSSHRHDAFPSYQSQNGPSRLSSAQSGSANVAYGMYPLQSMNPGGVTSNGPTLPPVVMLYPYDNNVGYGSPTELEFGSLGHVGYSGDNEMPHLIEGSRPGGVFEDQRFHGSSAHRSSSDQPSSPHHKRLEDNA